MNFDFTQVTKIEMNSVTYATWLTNLGSDIEIEDDRELYKGNPPLVAYYKGIPVYINNDAKGFSIFCRDVESLKESLKEKRDK